MPDGVLLALKQNLANAEKVGDADRVKRLKARLKELEKAAKAAAEPPAVEKAPEPATPPKSEKKET